MRKAEKHEIGLSFRSEPGKAAKANLARYREMWGNSFTRRFLIEVTAADVVFASQTSTAGGKLQMQLEESANDARQREVNGGNFCRKTLSYSALVAFVQRDHPYWRDPKSGAESAEMEA